MQSPMKPISVASLVLLGATSLALGDVTPEEVWQNWQDASAATGQTMIAASATRDGDSLVIKDITIASAVDGVTVEGSLAEVVMTDQGDGTVKVVSAPEFPMKMRAPAPVAGKPDVEMTLLLTHQDWVLLASGTVDDISYDMTAPSITLKLQQVSGPSGQTDNLTVDATLSDLAGTYGTKTVESGLQVDTDITIAGVALAMVGADPAQGSELRLTSSMEGVAIKSVGAVLQPATIAAISPEVLAKMDSTTDISIASTQFDLEIVDEKGPASVKGTTGASTVLAKMSGGVMDYAGAQSQIAMTINAPTIPVPDLSVTLDAVNFGIKLPLIPSDVALPFAFSTSLQNLALSDQLWAIFDPTASLPRDPINFVLDTEGTAKPNAMPAPGADMAGMPAELETLNLKQLLLSVAGADLQGSGTSTFEPAAPGGMPNPNAKLDFTLTGANALMDKLVAAGLLAPEMLTMPRMMLAMVARPAADGSDGYESTIEIKDKGIFANGQKLHQME